MDAFNYAGEVNLPSSSGGWQIAGVADFNRDGSPDLVMYNASLDSTKVTLMNGGSVLREVKLPNSPGWKPVATGDFNRDGKVDIVATQTNGSGNRVWYMNGSNYVRSADLPSWAGSNAVAAGDFNKDGNADVVIYNRDGQWSGIWLMQGTQQIGWKDLSSWNAWTTVAASDLNKDNVPDLIFYNPTDKSSRVDITNSGSPAINLPIAANTKPVGAGDFNRDGQVDLVTNNIVSGANVANLLTATVNQTSGNWVLKYREDFTADVAWPAWNRYTGVPDTANTDSWNKPENAIVSNGTLKLLIKPELNGDRHYSAAGIDTGFGFKQEYGKWSVRAKAAAGKGVGGYVGLYAEDAQGKPVWPPEIVLMEVQGKDPKNNVMTVWTQGSAGPEYNATTYVGTDFTAAFHTYTVEYEPGSIRWYIDGQLRKTATPTNFPSNLKWKIAIGDGVGTQSNSFTGAPDATTKFPTSMEVDWVEAYQRA
jgi:beta-glucanase (GH16 family)